MLFTPSTTGFACSGYVGLDFHRTRPTCPQIKHRTVMARDPAPAQDIGATYSKLPDAVRIALLPVRTVRQGLKRLQEHVQEQAQEHMQDGVQEPGRPIVPGILRARAPKIVGGLK
jgi:hypothetical protein